MKKKLYRILVVLLFISGCSKNEKLSVFKQPLYEKPNWFNITDNDFKTLSNSEEDYFILYCSASDILCQNIMDSAKNNVNLSFKTSFYFYDADQLIKKISDPSLSDEERTANITYVQEVMKKFAITSFPYLQYKQGSTIWGSKPFVFPQVETGEILTGKETDEEIQNLCEWINRTKQNQRHNG